MFWPNSSKIDQSGGGGLLLLFSPRDVPKISFWSFLHLEIAEIDMGVLLLFSPRDVPKISFWSFLHLEIAEIDMGVNFGSRRTILDIKTHFLKVKLVFQG